MLAFLPTIVIIITLAIVGAIVGPFINYAIYSWAMYLRRPLSPWMKLADEERSLIGTTSGIRRVPVIGWWEARKINFGDEVKGRFWIRPLLIELAWIIGLPLVYFWYAGGGLIGAGGRLPVVSNWDTLVETWFWVHTILLALLFIATFIDFDETMIPDEITVPGVVIGLITAVAFPWSRLPELGANAGGALISPITFASPGVIEPGHWSENHWGLITILSIFTVWALALLPRVSPFRLGIGPGIKYTIGSIVRPKRKTNCPIRVTQRRPFKITKILAVLWIIGTPLMIAAWQWLPAENWQSLLGAMIGLAVSGGLIWAIRIVGGLAMGQQAMGFGDVTLMAMVGTFIGWQASVAAFVYGIIVAMLAVIVTTVFIRNKHIPFGPYLSMGAVLAIYNWSSVWSNARLQIFALGPALLIVLVASLIGMMILLPIVRWLKELMLGTPS